MIVEAASNFSRPTAFARRKALLPLVLGLAVFVLPGCQRASKGPPTVRLKGSVTLDGMPIEDGSLIFLPQNKGQATPAAATIADGKYKADAVPMGRVLVRFSAQKSTGRKIRIPGSDSYEELIDVIPAKYALGISLVVSEENLNQNFELTTR
jgi:hypothetical protein